MKKKKYITPCVQLEQLAIETHLAAGSFQSDEPGAKPGNGFDDEFYNVHKGGFATNGATRLFISTSPGSKQVSLTQDC